MAVMKFRSNVARTGRDKNNDAYIDSGASHNFFHRRCLFSSYEQITPESVQIADGTSAIVGKGTVKVWLGKDVTMMAYHAPDFNANIVASHSLSESFEVLMSSSIRNEKTCALFRLGSLKKEDIVWETKCFNGLYPIKFGNIHARTSPKSLLCKSNTDEYNSWHDRVGHISSERFQHLSEMRNDVPSFSKSIRDGQYCIPFLTGKIHKAPVIGVKQSHVHASEVHFDISGPFRPSLGGISYAAHFLETRTSFSEV